MESLTVVASEAVWRCEVEGVGVWLAQFEKDLLMAGVEVREGEAEGVRERSGVGVVATLREGLPLVLGEGEGLGVGVGLRELRGEGVRDKDSLAEEEVEGEWVRDRVPRGEREDEGEAVRELVARGEGVAAPEAVALALMLGEELLDSREVPVRVGRADAVPEVEREGVVVALWQALGLGL